jgi:hypothetical protein
MTDIKWGHICCAECGSIDVQTRVWARVNFDTDEDLGSCEDDRAWCDDCNMEVRMMTVGEYIDRLLPDGVTIYKQNCGPIEACELHVEDEERWPHSNLYLCSSKLYRDFTGKHDTMRINNSGFTNAATMIDFVTKFTRFRPFGLREERRSMRALLELCHMMPEAKGWALINMVYHPDLVEETREGVIVHRSRKED